MASEYTVGELWRTGSGNHLGSQGGEVRGSRLLSFASCDEVIDAKKVNRSSKKSMLE